MSRFHLIMHFFNKSRRNNAGIFPSGLFDFLSFLSYYTHEVSPKTLKKQKTKNSLGEMGP